MPQNILGVLSSGYSFYCFIKDWIRIDKLPFELMFAPVVLALLYPSVHAVTMAESPIHKGGTAWMLVATALVLLMTLGLIYYYIKEVFYTSTVASFELISNN